MPKLAWTTAVVCLSPCLSALVAAGERPAISSRYKALVCSPPASFGTWGILERDGANRSVAPYLSSLAGGELGTGVIVSPNFTVSVETITFTICGHDGQGGGQGKNLVALVDARNGKVLMKTLAPGSDAMQPRSWDVRELKGRKVRVEVHDGIAAGGFAWLGVGRIDAGPQLEIEFRGGLPEGWKVSTPSKKSTTELVAGGIPFRALRETLVPLRGTAEVTCDFAAKRLFLLGCTVYRGKPLEVHGYVEILYRGGRSERYPLMIGYTLEGEFKLPSKSKALHLHRSGDPFQYYLVLGPRPEIIEKIKIARNPAHPGVLRITAVTCETAASGVNLTTLPDVRPDSEEESWIRSHTITRESPAMDGIVADIRRAHKVDETDYRRFDW